MPETRCGFFVVFIGIIINLVAESITLKPMAKSIKYFNTQADPKRCKWYLKPIMWLLCVPSCNSHKAVIKKTGMDGVKGPYILLCNHNAFYDFKVVTKAIQPRNANYIVAIDGFSSLPVPGLKWLMLNVGCVVKRKFTNDVNLIRQMIKAKEMGNIICFYPEARYSLCGTTAVLPASLGKFCKLLDIPVATFICNGHHVNAPFWNQKDRGVKGTEAELKLIYSREELRNTPVDEINRRLVEEFQYDDFRWQKEKGIKVNTPQRAEGLHKILYQCPDCGTEYEMDSCGDILECKHCGKKWRMLEDGSLQALEGETRFSHIPDWYEWERENVKSEVEKGAYNTGTLPVVVRSLPNTKHILVGNGTLVHNMDGFCVKATKEDGSEFNLEFPVPAKYSSHIEFNYRGYGDSLDLSTLQDTFFISPYDCKFSLTKIALATEELYYAHRRAIGKPCAPGLA